MKAMRDGTRRRLWIVIIAVLTVGYAMVTQVMQRGIQSRHQRDVSNSAIPMSSDQVPESVQNQIISRLGNVWKTDEIVFFPLNGNRVGVYATVDLGYADNELTTSDIHTIKSDINSWFSDVYQGQTVVADAEIYFLKDGRTVGGAGLGLNAYRALTASVSASEGANLERSLQLGPQVSGESVNESWVQTQA